MSVVGHQPLLGCLPFQRLPWKSGRLVGWFVLLIKSHHHLPPLLLKPYVPKSLVQLWYLQRSLPGPENRLHIVSSSQASAVRFSCLCSASRSPSDQLTCTALGWDKYSLWDVLSACWVNEQPTQGDRVGRRGHSKLRSAHRGGSAPCPSPPA